MSIFDEIREEMTQIPASTTTVEDAHMGLDIAQILTPSLRVMGLEGSRHAFMKIAALAIRGLELVDAEIEEWSAEEA